MNRRAKAMLILVGSLTTPLAMNAAVSPQVASASTTSCISAWSTIAFNPGSWTARPSATGQLDYNGCQGSAWGREYTLCYFGGANSLHHGPYITNIGDTSKSLCDYPDILADYGGEY